MKILVICSKKRRSEQFKFTVSQSEKQIQGIDKFYKVAQLMADASNVVIDAMSVAVTDFHSEFTRLMRDNNYDVIVFKLNDIGLIKNEILSNEAYYKNKIFCNLLETDYVEIHDLYAAANDPLKFDAIREKFSINLIKKYQRILVIDLDWNKAKSVKQDITLFLASSEGSNCIGGVHFCIPYDNTKIIKACRNAIMQHDCDVLIINKKLIPLVQSSAMKRDIDFSHVRFLELADDLNINQLFSQEEIPTQSKSYLEVSEVSDVKEDGVESFGSSNVKSPAQLYQFFAGPDDNNPPEEKDSISPRLENNYVLPSQNKPDDADVDCCSKCHIM